MRSYYAIGLMNNLKKFKPLIVLVSVFIVCYSIVYCVLAYSEPLHSPTTCLTGEPGCDAPINVGSNPQIKAGRLQVNGGMQIKNFDANPADTADGNWFHISGYTKTFDQAKAACVAQGARLAYYSEIVDAFNSGANSCSWGWVYEGFVVYPMQDGAAVGCGGSVGGVRVSYPALTAAYAVYCARDTFIANGSSISGGNLYAKGIYLNSGQSGGQMYLGLLANGQNADKVGICMEGVCKTAWDQVSGASYWTASGNNIYKNNAGNVGIGTATPNAALQIVKDASGGELLRLSGYSPSPDGYYLKIFPVVGSNTVDYRFQTVDNTGGTKDMLYLDSSSGNMGIGNIAPATKLDIAGEVKTRIAATGNSGGIQIGTETSERPRIGFHVSNNNRRFKLEVNSINTATERLGVFSNCGAGCAETEWLTINKSGNVGIGVTDPDAKLEVAGQIKITGGTPGAGKVLSSDANGLASWQVASVVGGTPGGSDSQIQYNNGGSFGGASQITYDDVNNRTTIGAPVAGYALGLGRLAAGGQPSIKSTDANGYLIMDSKGTGQVAALNWYTNDNVVLAYGGGNVGIGAITPGYRLDVNGNTRSSGGFYSTVAATDKFGNVNASGWGVDALNNGSWDLLVYNGSNLYFNQAYFGYGGAATIRTYNVNENLAIIPNGTGKVGIGNVAPAYKLDVTGQANATQLCIAGDCRAVWPAPGVGGEPGLPNNSVQFNNAGSFGGSANFLWDNGNRLLSIGGAALGAGNGKLAIRSSAGTGIYTTFQTGAQAANITYTLPTTVGVAGSFLQTTAAGVLSWTAGAALPAGAANQTLRYNATPVLEASSVLTNNGSGVAIVPTAGVALTLGRIGGQPNIKSSDAYLIMDSNTNLAALNYFSTKPVVLAYGNGPGLGGNVGVGNINPQTKLHISSTASILRLEDINSDGITTVNYIEFNDSNSRQGYIGFGSASNNNMYFANEENANYLFTGNGSVGIGATAPGAKLTIQTPNNYDGNTMRLESKLDPSNYNLNLNAVQGSNLVKWVFDQTNHGTSYPSVLTLDRGNVGVGTALPGAKFEVNESTVANLYTYYRARGGSSLVSGSIFLVNDSGGVGRGGSIGSDGALGGGLVLSGDTGGASAANADIFIQNGGKVGIGTTVLGNNKLEVVGGPIKATGGLIMETRTTNPAAPQVGQIWMCIDAGYDCQ